LLKISAQSEEYKTVEDELKEDLKKLHDSVKLEIEKFHRDVWNLHIKALSVKFDASSARQDHMDEIEQMKKEEKDIAEIIKSMVKFLIT
jgi:hypothetical protein